MSETKSATTTERADLTLWERELSTLHEAAAVVVAYRDRLTREDLLGRVLQWSSQVLLLERLNESYEYDGVAAVRPSDITRLRSGDRELTSIASLPLPPLSPELEPVGMLELSAALSLLAKQHGVIQLHTEKLDADITFVGEPLEVDDDFLLLRAWGTARSGDEARLLIRLDELTRIDADTGYLRALATLRARARVEPSSSTA